MTKADKPIPPTNTLSQSDNKPGETQYLRPRKRHIDKDDIADDPGGYQAKRVEKGLDQLEREGVVLNDHTVMVLRLMLGPRFDDDHKKLNLQPPSRQVIDAVIKRRLS